MTDFCEREIVAIEETFPGIVYLYVWKFNDHEFIFLVNNLTRLYSNQNVRQV
jgi:hypothetical protein